MRALAFAPHLEDVGLDAIPALEALVGDPLGRRHDGFGITKIEDRVAVVRLLHDARDQVAFPAFIDVVDLLTFRVAKSLADDLLRRLCRDPPEVLRGVFPLFNDVPVFVEFLAVDQDLPRVGVDRDSGFFGGPWCAFVGGDEGVCERVENGVGWDTLLTLEELQRVQQVVVHRCLFLRLLAGLCALFPHEHGACRRDVTHLNSAFDSIHSDDDLVVVGRHERTTVMFLVLDLRERLDVHVALEHLLEVLRPAKFAFEPG